MAIVVGVRGCCPWPLGGCWWICCVTVWFGCPWTWVLGQILALHSRTFYVCCLVCVLKSFTVYGPESLGGFCCSTVDTLKTDFETLVLAQILWWFPQELSVGQEFFSDTAFLCVWIVVMVNSSFVVKSRLLWNWIWYRTVTSVKFQKPS